MRPVDLILPLLPPDVGPAGAAAAEEPATLAVAPAERLGTLVRQVSARQRLRRSARHAVGNTISMPWPAGAGNRRGVLARARSKLLAGSIHVSSTSGQSTRLEMVARELDLVPQGRPRLGSGGGMRVRARSSAGPVMIRMGLSGSPADPRRHAAGLAAAAGRPAVPRLIGTGETAAVGWSVETFAPGRAVSRRADAYHQHALGLLASFPQAAEIVAPWQHAEQLSELVRSEAIMLHSVRERLAGVPGVLIHGDFWSGNLLVAGGAITGIVDWDAWHLAGAPATDLLHLHADALRRKQRTNYGQLVVRRFWADEPLATALGGYLRRLSLDDVDRDALGWAWWLTAVGAALERNPQLRSDEEWVAQNVLWPLQHG